MEITKSNLAYQIKLKQNLMRLNQEELEHSLREFTQMKNTVRSERTEEQQENVVFMSNHIKWIRSEYTRGMKELRSLKNKFKAYQVLDSTGNEFLFNTRMNLA